MIARISHEHAEREKLEQARQELLKRKQALIAENNKRKDDLASLDQDLERFIDVSFPLPWPLICALPELLANLFIYRPQNRSKNSLKSSINLVIEGYFLCRNDKAFSTLSTWRYPILLNMALYNIMINIFTYLGSILYVDCQGDHFYTSTNKPDSSH